MKLTKAQQVLVDAMKQGEVIHFLGGLHAHYFITGTMKNCTRSAEGLMQRGVVEKFDEDWKGFSLRLKKDAA